MVTIQTILDGLRTIGDRPALISEGVQWKGTDVLELSERCLTLLRSRHAQEGTVLEWRAGDAPEVLPFRLAAMQLGACFATDAVRPHSKAAVPIETGDLTSLATCTPSQQDAPTVDSLTFETARGPWRWSAADSLHSLATLARELGESTSRITVLSPLAGFGGDAVLAAWQHGATVRTATASTAARTLALLERVGTDCVVAPVSSLRALLSHPALALSDLSGLHRTVCDIDGPPLTAAELETARTQLGCEIVALASTANGLAGPSEREAGQAADAAAIEAAVVAHPAVTAAAAIADDNAGWIVFAQPGQRDHAPQQDDLSEEQISRAVDTALSGIDLEAAAVAVERLARTALSSMLNALQRCGLFVLPNTTYDASEVLTAARVAAGHRKLIRRWLKVLTQEGLLHREGDRYRLAQDIADCSDAALAASWDRLERDWRETAGASGTIDYARRNAVRLPELMSGEVQAVHLLFPEGRTDLARALYRESIAARYQHRSVAAVVSALARNRPQGLRLLEVGAGTGATSDTVLPALTGLNVDYLYTDVSRYFIDQAASRLGGHDGLRFGLYDIDRAPREQGYTPNSFDVIVGGGVLNAARNTDASVRWLTELLAPGGWLVLTEPTVEEFWVMASQAFMLVEADDDRRNSESTFLSLPQWNRLLDEAGLHRVVGLPASGHPLERLGHRVFVAQAKRDRQRLTPSMVRQQLTASPDPRLARTEVARIEIVDALPMQTPDTVDRDRLRAWAAAHQAFPMDHLIAAAHP